MSELEKEFSFYLSKIKTGSPGASEKCMDVLRELNTKPLYKVGELHSDLNRKISSYCKATGESHESVAIKIGMPKLK